MLMEIEGDGRSSGLLEGLLILIPSSVEPAHGAIRRREGGNGVWVGEKEKRRR